MHFMGSVANSYMVGKARAAVRVRVAGTRRDTFLIVDPDEDAPIVVLKTDALVAELPQKYRVVGPDGKQIRPSGTFLVTTETFDPYHLLIDEPKSRR